MTTGKRPPKRGEGQRRRPGTYLKVGPGCQESAFIGGEVFGCPGHWIHSHQPCCYALTDGQLSCKYCAAEVPSIWRGYLPLWDIDWKARYVLIDEEILPAVEAMQWRSVVRLSRGRNPISPLLVRPDRDNQRVLPDREPWNQPLSGLQMALILWQDDTLTQWYAKNPVLKPSDNAVSLEGVGKVKLDPMHANAAKKYQSPEAAAALGGDLSKLKDQIADRIARGDYDQPHNGKHAKTKKGGE